MILQAVTPITSAATGIVASRSHFPHSTSAGATPMGEDPSSSPRGAPPRVSRPIVGVGSAGPVGTLHVSAVASTAPLAADAPNSGAIWGIVVPPPLPPGDEPTWFLPDGSVPAVPVATAAVADVSSGVGSGLGFQPGGGTTSTMLPHLGQANITPTASWLRTLSRAWQVVQVMANRVCSTVLPKALAVT